MGLIGELLEQRRKPARPKVEEKLWDPLKHPRDGQGQWANKPGRQGRAIHAMSVIPTYDGSKLKFGKSAGGSNGARWAHHEDGSRWLVKMYGGNEDRVATELLSNAIYRETGARVPRAGRLPLHNGKQALTYEALDGKPVSRVFDKRGPSAEVGKHFMVDALLANWDVAGLDHDNILWDKDGQPFRVDQGGTLEFRAMGGRKQFGGFPEEVWSMMKRGGQGRESSAVTPAGMRAQARAIGEALTDGKIDELVDAAGFRDGKMRERVRKALKQRVKWMRSVGKGPAKPKPGLVEAMLLEAYSPFKWDPLVHPRDGHGKFRETLDKLKPGAGVQLDSKTSVKKDKDGAFRVTRSGKIHKGLGDASDAARLALDKSAKGTDEDSVGGAESHKDYNEFLKSSGLGGVDEVDGAAAKGSGVAAFGGKAMSADELYVEVLRLQEVVKAAEASDDKYVKRSIPTLRARAEEAAKKLGGLMKAGHSPSPETLKGSDAKFGSPEPEELNVGDYFTNTIGAKFEVVGKSATNLEFKNVVQAGDGADKGTVPLMKVKQALADGYWKKADAPGKDQGKAEDKPKKESPVSPPPDSAAKQAEVPELKPGLKFKSPGASAEMSLQQGVQPDRWNVLASDGKAVSINIESALIAKRFADGTWVVSDQGDAPGKGSWKPSDVEKAIGTMEFRQGGKPDGPVWELKKHHKLPDTYLFAKEGGGPGKESPLATSAQVANALNSGAWVSVKPGDGDDGPDLGGAKIGDAFTIPGDSNNSGVTDYKLEAFDPSQEKPITVSYVTGGGQKSTVQYSAQVVKGHFEKGVWKVAGADDAKKVTAEKSPLSPPSAAKGKPIKGMQTTADLTPEGQPSPSMKELHLEAGDVLQYKKGGWKWTVLEVKDNGAGIAYLKVQAKNGKIKHWSGYAKPQMVQKADGSKLKLKEPGDVAAAPKDKTVDKAWVQGKLKQDAKYAQMQDLPDGAVIETPAGQVGVLKKSEAAYQGYLTAYDIETGQKFEPHATNYGPHKYADDAATMAVAGELLKKAQAPASSSQASGPKAAAKPEWQHTNTSLHPSWAGALSGKAAEDHLLELQPTIPGSAKQAMKGYTNGGYGVINGGLRENKLTAEQSKAVFALDQAFHDAPVLDVDVITHRGAQLSDFHGTLKPGFIIQDNGYLSTSPTKPWEKEVQLHMRLRAGTKNALWVDNFSSHTGERETVVKRAALMEVLHVEVVGNKTHVYVDVVG